LAKSLLIAEKLDGDATTAATIGYYKPTGYLFSQSAEANNEILSRSAGTLSGLYVRVIAAATGNSVVRSRKNQANGNQTVTLTSLTTGVYEDTTNNDTIASGDSFSVQWDPTGSSGTATFTIISEIFDSTGDIVTFQVMGNSITSLSAASTTYFHTPQGRTQSTFTTEANTKYRVREAGTYKNLAVFLSSNARTSNTVWRSRKNGANGNLTLTFGSTVTGWLEDTTNVDTVAIGDDYNMSIANGTGITTYNYKVCKLEFTNTAGNCLILSSGALTAITDATTVNLQVGGDVTTTTTENNSKTKMRYAPTASELIILVTANTINASSTLKSRKNGANGNLTVTITTTAIGLFNDTTNVDVLAATDEYNFQYIATSVAGTQTTTFSWFGVALNVSTGTLVTRSISDPSISISDSVTRFKKAIRAVSNTVTFGDSVARVATKKRSMSESVSFGSSVSVVVIKPRAISQTISFTDSVSRKKIAIRAISETVSLSDSISRFKKAIRTIANTITFGDSITRQRTVPRTISNTITFGDSITRFKKGIRAISENIVFGDSITRIPIRVRSISNTISFGDSVTRFKKAIRSIANTVTFGDSVTRTATKFRSISQSISFGDSVTRFKKAIRAIPNTIIFGDSLTRVATKPRAISEPSISLGDSISRFKKAIRAINNSVSLGDTVTRVATKFRSINNPITFGDSIIRRKIGIRSIAETVSFSDSVIRFKKAVRTISDTVSFTSSVSGIRFGGGVINRTINESITFIDNVTRISSKFRSISESVSFTDNIARTTSKIRNMAESISISDTVTRLKKGIKSLSETINFTDTVQRVKSASRSMNESISFTDTVTRFKKAIRNISNTINFTDTVTISVEGFITRIISETINFNDSVTRSAKKFRSLLETISFTDNILAGIVKTVTIIESVSFNDSITRFKKAVKNILENVTVSSIVNVFRIKINRIDEILSMHPHEIVNDYIRDNWLENIESDWYLLPMKDKVLFQKYDLTAIGDFSVWVENVSSRVNRFMTDNQYAFYEDIVAIKVAIVYYPEPDHIKMKWHIRSFIEYLVETADLEAEGITNLKVISVREDDLPVSSNTYQSQNVSQLTVFALAEYTLLKLRL
jgi:hypothetical protein